MSKTSTWMPLYIGDYLADTMHLEAREHGAYLLLLMHYWRNGPLPDDDRALAGIARVDRKTWIADTGPIVRGFFFSVDGKLRQKRLDAERADADLNSAKKRAAAMIRHHGKGVVSDEGGTSGSGSGSPSDPVKLRSERMAAAKLLGRHTDAEWQAMLAFCGGVCLACGTQDNITKDHIKPIYQGGSDGIENLQPLCHRCNARKGADTSDLRADGWQNACTRDAYAYDVDVQTTCPYAGALPSPSPSKKDTGPTGPDAEPASLGVDASTLLWREGIPILQRLTGKSDGQCRGMLAKMRQGVQDDCPKLLMILQQARDMRPTDPVAWIMAATQDRKRAAYPRRQTASEAVTEAFGPSPFLERFKTLDEQFDAPRVEVGYAQRH